MLGGCPGPENHRVLDSRPRTSYFHAILSWPQKSDPDTAISCVARGEGIFNSRLSEIHVARHPSLLTWASRSPTRLLMAGTNSTFAACACALQRLGFFLMAPGRRHQKRGPAARTNVLVTMASLNPNNQRIKITLYAPNVKSMDRSTIKPTGSKKCMPSISSQCRGRAWPSALPTATPATPNENVLEMLRKRRALTVHLIKRFPAIQCRFALGAPHNLGGENRRPSWTLHQCDALDFDFGSVPAVRCTWLENLPYSVGAMIYKKRFCTATRFLLVHVYGAAGSCTANKAVLHSKTNGFFFFCRCSASSSEPREQVSTCPPAVFPP